MGISDIKDPGFWRNLEDPKPYKTHDSREPRPLKAQESRGSRTPEDLLCCEGMYITKQNDDRIKVFEIKFLLQMIFINKKDMP